MLIILTAIIPDRYVGLQSAQSETRVKQDPVLACRTLLVIYITHQREARVCAWRQMRQFVLVVADVQCKRNILIEV